MVLRRMRILSDGSVRFLSLKEGSAAASMVGEYWNAVTAYLGGNDEPLGEFERVSINGLRFETDPDVIEAVYQSGELSFEEIYEPLS